MSATASVLPAVQREEEHSDLPSLSNARMYNLLTDLGTAFPSEEKMLSFFDVWRHHKGVLYYRMKPRDQRGRINASDVSIRFRTREEDADYVIYMRTHNERTGEVSADVWEPENVLTYAEFERRVLQDAPVEKRPDSQGEPLPEPLAFANRTTSGGMLLN